MHFCSRLVAPCAGAWIEISCGIISNINRLVAPCAGAWIEIRSVADLLNVLKSLPARERGLKSQLTLKDMIGQTVAPCAGAWIEIVRSGLLPA